MRDWTPGEIWRSIMGSNTSWKDGDSWRDILVHVLDVLVIFGRFLLTILLHPFFSTFFAYFSLQNFAIVTNSTSLWQVSSLPGPSDD